jgi:hypothetical protein
MSLAEIKARRPQPHWPTIHRELRRPGVTLALVPPGAATDVCSSRSSGPTLQRLPVCITAPRAGARGADARGRAQLAAKQ